MRISRLNGIRHWPVCVFILHQRVRMRLTFHSCPKFFFPFFRSPPFFGFSGNMTQGINRTENTAWQRFWIRKRRLLTKAPSSVGSIIEYFYFLSSRHDFPYILFKACAFFIHGDKKVSTQFPFQKSVF